MTEVLASPSLTQARPRSRRPLMWLLPLLPAVCFLALFFVYPVGDLLFLSFKDKADAFSLDQYRSIYNSPVYTNVLLITLKISLMITAFCIVLGYPVAYLLANSDPKTRARLVIWVLMPFWTSFLVRAFAWMILLGNNGPLTNAVNMLGSGPPIKLLYNLTGVMIGTVQALLPLAILVMMAAMQNIDANLTRAASTMGARGGQAFWRIYFPLSFPGVAAAGLLTFITAIGFFITPALLGGPRETMIAQIILVQVQELLNWRFAGALSLLLLILAFVVFILYDRATGLSSQAKLVQTGAVTKPPSHWTRLGNAASLVVLGGLGAGCDLIERLWERVMPRRKGRPRAHASGPLRIVVTMILVFLVAPALIVVPVSFTAGTFIEFPPRGLSLRWYETYLGSSVWVNATLVSFAVAFVTGLTATILGTAAAFVFIRREFFGKRALVAMFIAPLVIPRIIIAVAMFYLFARLGLIGSIVALVIGHTVLALPFVVVTVMTVLKTHDERYDQAALTLGATPFRALLHITLPLIQSGIIAAFLFAFVTSFDELTVALFISAGTVTTLPKMMWSDLILQMNPTLAAVSTVILVIATVIVLAAEAIKRRSPAT